jgi:chorismate mutase
MRKDLELTKWRDEIDQIDAELVALIGRRMTASAAAGFRKRQIGLPPVDEAREKELLGRVDDPRVRALYRLILVRCRKHAVADVAANSPG